MDSFHSGKAWTSVLLFLVFLRGSDGWFFFTWGASCYNSPPVGCFPITAPFSNSGGIVPQDPQVIPTYFNSYRLGMGTEIFTSDNAQEIMTDRFDPSKKTVFIIHGYMEHARKNWVHTMVAELRYKEDANYITVDWGTGAMNVNYYQSVANTRLVGAVVALVLQTLQSLGGDLATFHLIGYSLGAHIAGYAGNRVPGLGRITGLDPAGPAFEGYPALVRLDPTDATLVDVIHTDGEVLGLGTVEPMGDVDFYPNRGVGQPGCPTSMLDRFTAAFYSTLSNALACSHFRVLDLYLASINNVCQPSSLSGDSLQIIWSGNVRRDGNTENGTWLPCQVEDGCPMMGYNLDSASIERTHFGLLAILLGIDFC
ncbi:hypothetical protein RRG08_003581 [Elysia crispata]|uniref:Lipase domain-containing protein n=1 Tax=Elysia crispata TaxID=231223 RepID=A0AAE0YHJ1_9GAST|nr:hypothetical protein RRG08_003581 [Elysia crispata]